jgi:hypothetical protein
MPLAPRPRHRLIVMAALLTSALGCAAVDGGGGSGAASCAYLVTYGDRTYPAVANVDFTVGEKLGTATVPACDDTPNDSGDGRPASKVTAYAVREFDPAVAIAVGDTPADAILVKVR